jgi:hypothetical protein
MSPPELIEAPTRQGMARLRVSPAEAVLELGDRPRFGVSGGWLTIARRKPLTLRVDGMRVLVARLFPTGEVALWIEHARLLRAVALAPLRVIDMASLAAGRALDRLGDRLADVLAERGCVTRRAVEFGVGENRALLVVGPDRMTVWARPLFREQPRRRLELFRNGAAIVPGRHGPQRLRCRSRWDVVVRGDFLELTGVAGETAAIWLPWIGHSEREELAAALGSYIDP